MRRGRPDRVPVNIRGARLWDSHWLAGRHPSYRPLIEAVAEHCDVIPHAYVPGLELNLLTEAERDITEHQTIDSGDWEIHRTILHTPRGDLTQDYWVSKQGYLPLIKKHFVETPEDSERVLSVPYVPPALDLGPYLRLREEWPDNLVMCDCPQAPSYVHELLGTESFAYWWAEQRHLLFRLREMLEERVLDAADFLLARGVGPVLATHGSEQIAPPMHSPQTHREFVLSSFKELCARIHAKGCLLHVHCHNKLNALLEDFVSAGWDVLHPLEPPPMGDVVLADAKRRVGTELCLEGNLQIGELYAAPTEAVVTLVEEAMRDGKPGGGFILCPSASPHTPTLSDLTVRNYLAMVHTAVKLREYL